MATSGSAHADLKTSPDIECELTPEMGILLGSRGIKVLEKVLRYLDGVVQSHGWPQPTVTLRLETDMEIPDWKGIIILFSFAVPEAVAEAYLGILYPDIDVFAKSLTPAQRDLFDRLIWFDVTTA